MHCQSTPMQSYLPFNRSRSWQSNFQFKFSILVMQSSRCSF